MIREILEVGALCVVVIVAIKWYVEWNGWLEESKFG